MCLIVGLGNPGKKYERTRHNVGFLALDEVAALAGTKFKNKCEVNGLFTETKINNRAVELLKPGTFMNLSGEAVFAAAKKWRVPTNKITLILDDANLPLGTIRTREGGSAGGHNGLKSIIEKLGTDKIRRVRVGIGRPPRPEIPLDKWVLEKFNKEEWKIIAASTREVAKMIVDGELFIG
jgi:PTH1 family peptidyl-tRNA hydrolase